MIIVNYVGLDSVNIPQINMLDIMSLMKKYGFVKTAMLNIKIYLVGQFTIPHNEQYQQASPL